MIFHRFIARAAGVSFLLSQFLVVSAVNAEEDGKEAPLPPTAISTIGVDSSLSTYTGSDVSSGAPPQTVRMSTSDWKFGYHGYLRAPFRMSLDSAPIRKYVRDDQGTVLLDDDGLPILKDTGDREWHLNMPQAMPSNDYKAWAYTKNMPSPWAEMLLSYGNSIVTGNLTIATRNLTDGGWRNTTKQLGIDQAWVTANCARAFRNHGGLKLDVGVFGNRYGTSGRWDPGVYDTYLFGRTHVAGETLTANIILTKRMTLILEHGIGAKTDVLKGNPQEVMGAVTVAGDNTMSWLPYDGDAGNYPAIINHAHAGLLIHNLQIWDEMFINAHFLHAFTVGSSDSDVASAAVAPENRDDQDGKYLIAGAELKLNGAFFGDLYLGFSTIKTDGIARMPNAIEVVHSIGGWSFLENYYGDIRLKNADDPNLPAKDGQLNPGTGRVNTFLWQYTFSAARLLWHLQGERFFGQGPDLQVRFFGMFTAVHPDEKLIPYLKRYAEKKLKLGGELFYTPHKYFGFGLRLDHVIPDLNYNQNDNDWNDAVVTSYAPFTELTPEIRIKTAFVTREEVNIKYTRLFWNGDRDEVRAGSPHDGISADRNALMVEVNMWW